MKFIIEFLCIILISMIFVSIDLNNYNGKCIINLENPQKIYAFFIIIIHHIIGTIANIGWIFYSKVILIIFIIIVIIVSIHWMLNGNKCFITQRLNKFCYLPDDHRFPDFFYIIGLKYYDFWNNWACYLFYFFALIYAVYKIFIL